MSHTSTGQWQSFEVRMRHRRAERLLVRAEVAAEAGCFADAHEALDEARKLLPTLPGLTETEQRVTQLETAPIPTAGHRRLWIAAAVACLVAIAAAAVFLFPRRSLPATAQLVAPPQQAAETFTPKLSTQPTAGSAKEDTAASTGTSGTAAGADAPVRVETTDVRSPIVVASPTSIDVPPAPTAPASALSQPQETPPAANRDLAAPERSTLIDRPATPPPMRASAPASSNPVPVAPPVYEVPTLPEATRAALPPSPEPAKEPVRTSAAAAAPLAPPIAERIGSPAPAANVTPSREPVVSDEALVRTVLNRYATAYSQLDVRGAKEAWPSVNGPALARAFDNLASQQVSLDSCAINVRGPVAHAACDGKAMWRPKIGSGGTHTEQRKWAFDLVKSGESWQIATARVQNR